jgi:HK97 family phage major capsid protein
MTRDFDGPLERKSDDNDEGLHEQVLREVKGFGEDVRNIRSTVERQLAEQKERTDRIETALRRHPTGSLEDNFKKAPTPEEKAFSNFLRRGDKSMPEVELKALTVGDNTAGGYLVTSSFSREVIKNLVEISPVRQAARVGSMVSSEILIPKRTGKPTARWVGETEDREGTQASYGQVKIAAHEAACFVDVSVKLLEDAEFSVETEIAGDLAEEFGRIEGESFTFGDGVDKPSGFLVHPDVPEVASGHATQITADGLIDFFYALPAFYRSQSSWMMNGTTLAAVRKLKDGQGQYLWHPGIAAEQPSTILDRPVVEAVDMPDIVAGATPIALGAFQHTYRIYDRVGRDGGMSLLRDPFTLATKGLVRFHARRRVGAGVVKAEALRKLKIAEIL